MSSPSAPSLSPSSSQRNVRRGGGRGTDSDEHCGVSSSSSSSSKRRRRFAPLDPERESNYPTAAPVPALKGIVFDVDGTLCLPQNHMFAQMRQTLAIQKPTDILMHVRSLPLNTPPPPTSATPLNHRPTASLAIQAIERDAMTTQTPQPGLLELMTYLEKRGVRKALCTRNFSAPVKHLCETFMPGIHFDPIITRETTDVMPKPSPMGLWRCAEAWATQDMLTASEFATSGENDVAAKREDEKQAVSGLSEAQESDPLEMAKRHLGSGLIMVGDSLDDMAAGHRAGAATILLASDETEEELLRGHEYVDLVVRRLDEIIPVLERGFEGRS